MESSDLMKQRYNLAEQYLQLYWQSGQKLKKFQKVKRSAGWGAWGGVVLTAGATAAGSTALGVVPYMDQGSKIAVVILTFLATVTSGLAALANQVLYPEAGLEKLVGQRKALCTWRLHYFLAHTQKTDEEEARYYDALREELTPIESELEGLVEFDYKPPKEWKWDQLSSMGISIQQQLKSTQG